MGRICKCDAKTKTPPKKYSFDVISYITAGYEDKRIFNLSKILGFYTIYNHAYNPKDLSLIISEKDSHPSELGHRRNAEGLLNFMIREGIVDKHIKKKLK